MPINLAVLDIFPLNFFNWETKYCFSTVSLASFNGILRVSVTENSSSIDLDKDS